MIKAHLIRTAEVDEEVFTSVVQYLQQFKGEVEFIHHYDTIEILGKPKRVIKKNDDDFDKQDLVEFNKISAPELMMDASRLDFPEVNAYPWQKFFDLIKKYRKKKGAVIQHEKIASQSLNPLSISKDDHVFILTYQANVEKWFVGSEMHNGRNHFIHLLYWNHYILSEPVYPVAYHVMSTILKNQTFGDISGYLPLTHQSPKGCMMDMCWNKTDVILKLRTADICPDCMKAFVNHAVNRNVLRQALQIFDHVRVQVLFRERFFTVQTLPTLHINLATSELSFPELSDLKVSFRPLEMTVYAFFLRHPMGIILSYLPDYYEELLSIYLTLTPHVDIDQARDRMADLTNPLSNSMSEKISRIKAKLKIMLGEEIAQPFFIQGPNGGLKKIEIPRDRVTYLNL
jgi:hypothetical protein